MRCFAILGGAPGRRGRASRKAGPIAERWLTIAPPMGEAALRLVMRQLVSQNRVRDGLLYLQITRGVAPRELQIPRQCLVRPW